MAYTQLARVSDQLEQVVDQLERRTLTPEPFTGATLLVTPGQCQVFLVVVNDPVRYRQTAEADLPQADKVLVAKSNHNRLNATAAIPSGILKKMFGTSKVIVGYGVIPYKKVPKNLGQPIVVTQGGWPFACQRLFRCSIGRHTVFLCVGWV